MSLQLAALARAFTSTSGTLPAVVSQPALRQNHHVPGDSFQNM
jgi:hypothetical protein